MSKSPDYILDIQGLTPEPSAAPEAQDSPAPAFRGRPWLAVHWRCCNVYSRIYRNADGSAYEGRCPRCNKAVRAVVGPGGTTSRFFEAH